MSLTDVLISASRESWHTLFLPSSTDKHGAVIYYLKGIKSEYAKTSSLIDSIIRTTVESNGITCVVAVVALALFLTSDTSTGLYFVIPQ